MIERVKVWLASKCDEAEARETCMVARSRNEWYRLCSAESAGLISKVAPRAYARPDYWGELDSTQQALHRMRALQEQHPDWMFAGPSAALIHGMAVNRRYLQRLYIGTSRRTHLRSNETWQAIIVTSADVQVINGIRVTPWERTLVDSLRLVDFPSGLAIADSAVGMCGGDPLQLAEDVTHACRRVAGIKKTRAVIALADGRAESGGESVARAVMLELGMMVPDLQRWYADPLMPEQRYRADFVWDVVGGSILGELDGREKYENPEMTKGRTPTQVIEDEHRRQSHIMTRPDVLNLVRFAYGDVLRATSFLELLLASGVPRNFSHDDRVVAAGGTLRCR